MPKPSPARSSHTHGGPEAGPVYQLRVVLPNAILYSTPLTHDEAMELGKVIKDKITSAVSLLERDKAKELVEQARTEVAHGMEMLKDILIPQDGHFSEHLKSLEALDQSFSLTLSLLKGN